MKTERNYFLIHRNFLTVITISLFYCCERCYKYMDDWEKFSETSLPEKEDTVQYLNMKDIADEDYEHAKRVNIMLYMFIAIHCYIVS